ncbi:MAG: metallophosphoesterase [Verrucomicrobiae bacterium]|nr:metallophosphoesterase [Verrucomicrobiae bacterium]
MKTQSLTLSRKLLLLVGALALAIGSGMMAAPPSPVEGGFTLVVVPDSQIYVWKRPELYTLQTGWIAANVDRYNMVQLLHVGDITQRDSEIEWAAALRAHRVYAGLLPAVYAQGNHDMAIVDKYRSRSSNFSRFIPLETYEQQPGFGGVYDREPLLTQNSYHLLEAGGRKWLTLALEFAPRDDVLRWANEIVARHPDRSVILLTHAYLQPDATRYDRHIPSKDHEWKTCGLNPYTTDRLEGGFNDGEDMWRKLVSKHANFSMVICGHICTSAHLASRGEHGNTVHQILVDYQNHEQGGNGWLRLLQFSPDARKVRVRDYSPLLDETSTDPACAFEFELE